MYLSIFQAGQKPDTGSWEDDEPYNKRSRYPQNESRGGFQDDRSFDRRRHHDDTSFRGRGDATAFGGMEARYQQSLGQAEQPWTRPPPLRVAPPRYPEPQQSTAGNNTWAQEAERFINRSQQGMNIPLLPGAVRDTPAPSVWQNLERFHDNEKAPVRNQAPPFGRPLREEKQAFGRRDVGHEERLGRPLIDRPDRSPERSMDVRADFGRQMPRYNDNYRHFVKILLQYSIILIMVHL